MLSEVALPLPAPPFDGKGWINTDHKLHINDLRGQVVLVSIWDYTSIHCLQTIPVISRWHAQYAEAGLAVVGVHTPQFDFGRERQQVELSVQELGVAYPVALDNDYRTWDAYQNQFWPAAYLIDQHGRIRYQHYGQSGLGTLERALQGLLRERDSAVELWHITLPDDTFTGRLHRRPTPDLRGGLQRGHLGNPEGYAGKLPILYRLPEARSAGSFYVAGAWQAGEQYIAYQGQSGGMVQIPYEAASVYAILSPHADPVERAIHPQAVDVEIWQDDQPLDESRRGTDITDDGRVIVNRPRAYNLIRNPDFESHEITLRVKSRGFALYGLAFVAEGH